MVIENTRTKQEVAIVNYNLIDMVHSGSVQSKQESYKVEKKEMPR